MKRNIFVFIGAPASGKGTRIKKLEERGYKSISTSSLLKEQGYDLSKGTLINDSIVSGLVISRINILKGKNIILDGFPRTINQFEELRRRGIKIDKAFYIKVSKEIMIERAKDRLTCSKCQASFTKSNFKRPQIEGICDYCGGKLIERPDDKEELFEKRLEEYIEKTKPILQEFSKYDIPIITIDANLNPEEVLKYI